MKPHSSLKSFYSETGKLIRREYHSGDTSQIDEYHYNAFDRPEASSMLYNGVPSEIKYYYTYNDLKHITQKTVLLKRYSHKPPFELMEEHITINKYHYDYDAFNRIIKKVCCDDGCTTVYYITKYIYSGNKLILAELCTGKGLIHRMEHYYYLSENVWEKKVVFPDGALSCYIKCSLLDSHKVRKELISPVRGPYKWRIDDCDAYGLTISPFEDIVTPPMLCEILDYAVSLKKTSLYLCTQETDMMAYSNEIGKIMEAYKEKFEIIVNYFM